MSDFARILRKIIRIFKNAAKAAKMHWDFYEKLSVDRFEHSGSSDVKTTRDLV